MGASGDLRAILDGAAVPARAFEAGTFESLRAFAVGIVQGLGVRGLDADAIAAKVLSGLERGPIGARGNGQASPTLQSVLRHRLDLEVRHFWRSKRRRAEAMRRAATDASDRAETGSPAPVDVLVARDEVQRVRAALDRLPFAERTLLVLFHRVGLPTEEIRARMGYRSLNVLYVRLAQARARLRGILAEGRSRP